MEIDGAVVTVHLGPFCKLGRKYRVDLVDGFVTDVNGNFFSASTTATPQSITSSFEFTVTEELPRLQVAEVFPRDGSVDVSPTANIVVTFTQDVLLHHDPATVGMQLTPEFGERTELYDDTELLLHKRTILFVQPNVTHLAPGQRYKARLRRKTVVSEQGGEFLEQAFVWYFTVANQLAQGQPIPDYSVDVVDRYIPGMNASRIGKPILIDSVPYVGARDIPAGARHVQLMFDVAVTLNTTDDSAEIFHFEELDQPSGNYTLLNAIYAADVAVHSANRSLYVPVDLAENTVYRLISVGDHIVDEERNVWRGEVPLGALQQDRFLGLAQVAKVLSPRIFFGDHEPKTMHVVLGGRDEILNNGSTCYIEPLSGADGTEEVTMRAPAAKHSRRCRTSEAAV
jgi:hypothetical protein